MMMGETTEPINVVQNLVFKFMVTVLGSFEVSKKRLTTPLVTRIELIKGICPKFIQIRIIVQTKNCVYKSSPVYVVIVEQNQVIVCGVAYFKRNKSSEKLVRSECISDLKVGCPSKK